MPLKILFTFVLALLVTFSATPHAAAESTLSENDKRMIYLTCINRKPIKPINAQAAQECARTCKPNNNTMSDDKCLELYQAATGQAYVPTPPPSTINSAPYKPGIREQNSSSAR